MSGGKFVGEVKFTAVDYVFTKILFHLGNYYNEESFNIEFLMKSGQNRAKIQNHEEGKKILETKPEQKLIPKELR